MKHRTMITAHAGSEGLKDNSLESIIAMCSYGADCVEFDVRRNNGTLILSHNPPEEGFTYVTLARAFEEAAKAPGLLINIDLKETGLPESVLSLAESCGLRERCLFTGHIDDGELPVLRRLKCTCWHNGQDIPEDRWNDPFGFIESRGFQILNTHYMTITDDMLREYSRRLSVWTLNTEELLARFLNAGVYNITTRLPLTALRLRDEIQGRYEP